MTWLRLFAGALIVISALPVSGQEASLATSPVRAGAVLWRESFTSPLDWSNPGGRTGPELAQVFSITQEGGRSLLRANHDASQDWSPGALHYGKVFPRTSIALDQVRALRWRWRARVHPVGTLDPWQDMALSVYVVIKAPSLFARGRGFKFGWLSKPGRSDNRQHGIVQVPVRTGGPTGEWQSEEVDLCAAYRQAYGPCEGQHVLYIGVVTDADGTKSIAAGDYADFELLGVADTRGVFKCCR
jgi:hypothetical protein